MLDLVVRLAGPNFIDTAAPPLLFFGIGATSPTAVVRRFSQFVDRSVVDDLAVLKQYDGVGDLSRVIDVLLDDEQRRSAVSHFLECRVDIVDDDRGEAER